MARRVLRVEQRSSRHSVAQMMDQTLSEILADVSRAHGSATQPSSGDATAQGDLQLLVRAWVNERASPELLPYPKHVMERVMENIRQQIETIEEATARMDAGTSFGLVVIQTELERYKFLVRSLLRARITKIDAHPLHILSLHDPSLVPGVQSQDSQRQSLDDGNALLSSPEASYAKTHAALLERHYTSSFLSSFPPKLRQLDDRAGAGGVGMVEGPDLDQAVFVRCLGSKRSGRGHGHRAAHTGIVPEDEEMEDVYGDDEYGPVEAPCGFTATSHETDAEDEDTSRRNFAGEKTVHMQRGDIWIVRWRGVREAVAKGECELI